MTVQSQNPRSITLVVGVRGAVVAFLIILGCFLIGFFSSRLFASEVTIAQSRADLVIPPEGLTFRTSDGRPVASLTATSTGGRFRIFSISGTRSVELNAFQDGGDVSVYDNGDRGALLSIFASPRGGQLTLMNGPKAAIQMSSNQEGGYLSLNESGGYPVLDLSARDHQGRIDIHENGGPEKKLLWHAP